MPPYIETTCPKCGCKLTVDLAELKSDRQVVYRMTENLGEEGTLRRVREYRVTCKCCGHTFKLPVSEE